MPNAKIMFCLAAFFAFFLTTVPAQAKRSNNDSDLGDYGSARANPTRPSVSDNAYLVSPGHLELEIGGLIDPDAFAVPTLLKAAISEYVELGVSSSGLISVDTAADQTQVFQDPGFQVKSRWIGTEYFSFASVGRAEWIGRDDAQFTLYGVASGAVSKVACDVTVGGVMAPQDGGGVETVFNYAVALYPNWDKRFGFYGEIFGSHAASGDPVGIDAGVSYAFTPRFVVDAAVFKGLNASAADWQLQAGFTWTIAQFLPR